MDCYDYPEVLHSGLMINMIACASMMVHWRQRISSAQETYETLQYRVVVPDGVQCPNASVQTVWHFRILCQRNPTSTGLHFGKLEVSNLGPNPS